MTKYSYELKKKVVSAYLNDEGGYEYLSKKYDISHHDIVRRWVKSYNKFGDKGLARSRQNNNYSFQFKLSVVPVFRGGYGLTLILEINAFYECFNL